MVSKTERVTITITRNKSVTIINTLRRGLRRDNGAELPETSDGKKLLSILVANFEVLAKGTHFL